MSTMRAIAIDDFGAPPTLRDLPTPHPGPGEILVRVHASSINGFDVFVASGMAKGMMEHRFPVVPGKDFAGTVAALGTGADHGGDTSTVTNTAPVNFTARSTSDSASAPMPIPLRTIEQAYRTLEQEPNEIRMSEQSKRTREHPRRGWLSLGCTLLRHKRRGETAQS